MRNTESIREQDPQGGGATSHPSKRGLARTLLSTGLTMLAYGVGIKAFRGVMFRANVGIGRFLASTAGKNSAINRFASSVGRVAKAGIRAGKYTPGQIEGLQKLRGWYGKLKGTVSGSLAQIGRRRLTMSRAMKGEAIAQQKYFAGPKMDQNIRANLQKRYTGNARYKDITMPELTSRGTLKDIRATTILKNTKKVRDHWAGKWIEKLRGDKLLKPRGDLFAKARRQSAKFGGKDFGKAMASRLFRYGTDFLSYAPIYYAGYRMATPDNKKWYQPSAMAEWAGFAIKSDIVFRGAMPSAAIAGKKLLKGITAPFKSLKGVIKPTTVEKSFDFLERIAKSVPLRAAQIARTNVNTSVGKPTIGNSARYTSEFFKQYNKYKQIIRRDPKQYLRGGQEDFSRALNALKNLQEKKNMSLPKTETLKNLDEHFNRDEGAGLRFFNKLIGGSDRLQKATTAISPHEVGGAFGKQTLLANKGTGVMSFRGKEWDLRNILPKRAYREAMRTLTKWKIAGVTPFGWFGNRAHFEREAPFVQMVDQVGARLHLGTSMTGNLEGSRRLQRFGARGRSIAMEEAKRGGTLNKGEIRNLSKQGSSPYWASTDMSKFETMAIESRSKLYSPQDTKRAAADLKRGIIRVEEGESFFMMGDKAYYSLPVPGKKVPQVFRVGYDSDRGVFHRFKRISESMGGSGADAYHYHWGAQGSTDIGGTRIFSQPSPRISPRQNPNDTAFKQISDIVLDKLEAGSKEELTIFAKMSQFLFGRWKDPNNFRTFASDEYLFNPEFTRTMTRDDVPIVFRRLHTSARRMETVQTQRVFKSKKLIGAIRDDMKGDPSGNGTRLLNTVIDPLTDDAQTKMRKTRALGKIMHTRKEDLNPELKKMLGEMMNESGDDFLKMQTSTYETAGKYRMTRLDAYNNLVYRTWLRADDYANLDRTTNNMINKGLIKRAGKMHKTLDMTRLIGEFDNLNIEDQIAGLGSIAPEEAGIKVFDKLLGKFRGSKPALMELGESVQPITGMWMSNRRVFRAANDYPRLDMLISKNMDDSGNRIMSYLEQIAPRSMANSNTTDPLTSLGLQASMTVNAINNVGNLIGIGFSKQTAASIQSFAAATLYKRILPAAAIAAAWQTADMAVDESGLFEGTSLGEGLNVFASEQIAKGRLAIARVNDALGVTDSAKYLEDLMPGSITSGFSGILRGFGVPVLGSALGVAKGGPKGAMIGGAIGGVISLMTAGGPLATVKQFDITKSRRELFEEYGGRKEVPIYKGQGWLFGGGSVGGMRVDRFQPNWFHRMRSQYKHSDVLYGDKCFAAGSEIQTINGMKKIEEIKVGEKSYCIDGSETTIIKIQKNSKEDRRILSMGAYSLTTNISPMNMTEDHRVLAIKTIPCRKKTSSSQNKSPCLKSRYEMCSRCKRKFHLEYVPSLCEVRDLIPGDYVIESIPTHQINNKFVADIYIQGKKHSVSFEKTPDLYYMIGYYLAEGSLKWSNEKIPTSIQFSHHVNERYMCEPLERLASNYNANIYHKKILDTYTEVSSIHNGLLSQFIYNICGHLSDGKRISQEVLNTSDTNLKQLLRGYLNGDGSIDNDRITYSTVSKELALGIRNIGVRLGYVFSISKRDNKGKVVSFSLPNGKIVQSNAKDAYQGGIYGYSNIKVLIKDIFSDLDVKFSSYHLKESKTLNRYNYFYFDYHGCNLLALRIGSIKEVEYDSDIVYDVTVDKKDHLLKSASYLVHNTEQMFASLNPLGDHYYNKHKYSRPYPVKEMLGSNIPLVGNMAASIPRMADNEDLRFGALAAEVDADTSYQTLPFGNASSIYSDERGWGGNMLNGAGIPLSANAAQTPTAVTPGSFPSRVNATFRTATEFAGLRGFLTQELVTGMNDGMYPFENVPTLASASWMTSPSRMFWDQEWGDVLATTEMIRRFIPKKGQHVNEWNEMCITPDVLVQNENSDLILADNVKVGSSLIGKDGMPHKVIASSSRLIDESIYHIATRGTFQVLSQTGNHPVLGVKVKYCHHHPERKQACYPGRKNKKCDICGYNDFNEKRYSSRKHYNDYMAEWIPTEELKEGDAIAYPIPILSEKMKTLKFSEYTKYTDITSDGRIKAWRANCLGPNDEVILDKDFGRFCGFYLAEGSIGSRGKQITFSFHEDETEYHEFIRNIAQRFDTNTFDKRTGESRGLSVVVCSKYIADLINKLFGRVKCKRIDHKLYDAPKDFIKGLLQGYFEGDGHSEEISLQGTTVVPAIAIGIQNLLLGLGIVSSIYRYHAHGAKIIAGNVVKSRAPYTFVVQITGDAFKEYQRIIYNHIRNINVKCKRERWMSGGYLFSCITKISKVSYSGPVLDFQIEDAESFCTSNHILHNSNIMPRWLPGQGGFINFQTGDPFTKIKRGEARLPGAGYTTLKDVRYNFPFEAEYMGQLPGEQVGILTGQKLPIGPDDRYDRILSGKIANEIAKDLSSMNADVKLAEPLFHPFLNLSGKADLVVDGKFMKIKAMSNRTFNATNDPLPKHLSEMNAILHMSKSDIGGMIYVNAETGESKSFNVGYDPERFSRDFSNLESARSVAENLMNKHGPTLGVDMGQAYSRADRLRILGDVAPYSKEFRQTLQQLKALNKAGKLDMREIQILDETLRQVDIKRERYIYTERKFNRGNPVTTEEEQYQEAIRGQYSPLERMIGSGWEAFSHMKSPIHTKFLNTYDPMEQYARMEVYGKPIRMWGNPYQDFLRPYATSMMNITNPIQGAASWGTGGLILGGPFGGALAAGIGGFLGAVKNAPDIPGYRQKERHIIDTLDQVQYKKAKQAYEMTGDIEALKDMKHTMTWAYDNASTINQVIAATPRPERAFMERFLAAGTMEEREQIMSLVPDYLKPILSNAWMGGSVSNLKTMTPIRGRMPVEEWEGWRPEYKTEDIAVKVFNRESLDAHDLGLGWQSQIRQMAFNPGIPETFTQEGGAPAMSSGSYEQAIRSAVPNARVFASVSPSAGVTVNIRMSVEDTQAINNDIRVRYGSVS